MLNLNSPAYGPDVTSTGGERLPEIIVVHGENQ
jgi:hypothetical protein